jgi:hypothetical protein
MTSAILCSALQTVLFFATKCGFEAPSANGGRQMTRQGSLRAGKGATLAPSTRDRRTLTTVGPFRIRSCTGDQTACMKSGSLLLKLLAQLVGSVLLVYVLLLLAAGAAWR